jgi:hypothetical protein
VANLAVPVSGLPNAYVKSSKALVGRFATLLLGFLPGSEAAARARPPPIAPRDTIIRAYSNRRDGVNMRKGK